MLNPFAKALLIIDYHIFMIEIKNTSIDVLGKLGLTDSVPIFLLFLPCDVNTNN